MTSAMTIHRATSLRWPLARALLLAVLGLALWMPATATRAQVTDARPLQFQDQAEERRFHALVAELRCVMCQNQSLADSNAQIAQDLRREVLGLMREGRSDAEVKAFLVARYGDFVLYRPQVAARTWLLWFGPALLLLGGGLVIARIIRRRGGGRPVDVDEGQEW
jgi:cytochrome c-type biogenesis protein CcmH